jgi:hypothetical protein
VRLLSFQRALFGLLWASFLACGSGEAGLSDAEPPSQDSNDDASASEPGSLQVRAAQFTGEGEPLRLLRPGDDLDIALAEQGGEVLYIGAEIRGLDATEVTIRTALTDPDTGRVHVEEEREIRVRPADTAGALEPDLRSRNQVSHLIVCPNAEARPVFGVPWELSVEIEALDSSAIGKASLEVVPRCALDDSADQARCVCECEANYERGKCAE